MKKLYLIGILLLLLTACNGAATTTRAPYIPQASSEPQILRIMTHDSFAISEEALAQFEKSNNARVEFLKSGDTGSAINKAILSKNNPLADVFYGVDNTFLSRALDEGIFEAYAAPGLSAIPAEFQLDKQSRALPVDYGDVCLNYDKAYFAQNNLPVPQSLDDLLKPQYKGLLVVQNPATSSPGLAFLFATIGVYGEDGYLAYWQGLQDNDLLVVNDWESAYYTEFSGSSGRGPRPIVVSYSSSPAFEVIYAETPLDEPPTAAITSANTCFRQIEFVGLLKGARAPELGRRWIDFMLSTTFQEDLPTQMFVFPVNPQAKLDKVFTDFLSTPQRTVRLSAQDIAQKRAEWLQAWTAQVLR